ncbi:MAG: hypothetical protein GX149_03345 [Acholeplasmataceae bacterium]|jgi:sugar diacid utilization regulator|nr:hypothetical protein [Acholeplasmataceae bacterium]
MYGYYILIKGITQLNLDERYTLLNLLNELMVSPEINLEEDILSAIDIASSNMSWQSFIVTVNGDFYTDLRLYESIMFSSRTQLLENLLENKTKQLFNQTYNNDKTVFYRKFSQETNEKRKKEIFKALYNDQEFLRSIKIYLEENKNKSRAAKVANLHRNTLDNRLEKFYQVTGYDVRNFKDAVFIYLFLKDYE